VPNGLDPTGLEDAPGPGPVVPPFTPPDVPPYTPPGEDGPNKVPGTGNNPDGSPKSPFDQSDQLEEAGKQGAKRRRRAKQSGEDASDQDDMDCPTVDQDKKQKTKDRMKKALRDLEGDQEDYPELGPKPPGEKTKDKINDLEKNYLNYLPCQKSQFLSCLKCHYLIGHLGEAVVTDYDEHQASEAL